jgi:hypothetical protein
MKVITLAEESQEPTQPQSRLFTARNGGGDAPVLSPGSNTQTKEIAPEKLQKNLAKLTSEIGTMLTDIKHVGGFQLTQVQVAVEMSAEGGFALVGSAKAGVKGAINLTFTIPENNPNRNE